MIETSFPIGTKTRNGRTRILVFCLFAFVFSATLAFLSTSNQDKTEAASTKDFKAGNIMSDAVMSDYNSMTIDQIQAFLKSKNACNMSAEPSAVGASRYENVNITKHGVTYNRRYYFGSSSGLYHVKDGHFVCMADESFNGRSAAYHIWDAAQTFKINPKVLIVLLEKEQSLITDKFPYEVQYRAATGYGCPDTAACDSKYYGLEAQLGNAAYLFHTVLSGGWTNFPLGTNYIQYNPNPGCGGSKVKIENLATSALYRYTPYQPNSAALAAGYGVTGDGCGAYGNRNFFLLYSDWFGNPRAGGSFNTNTVTEKLPALESLDASKKYQIVPSSNTKKTIDISGGVSANSKSGSLLIYQKRDTNILNQSFMFKYDASEQYYYIVNPTSNLRLDVSGASSKDGAEVLLWTGHIGCNQKWTIKESKGKYVVLSACSGKALTAENGKLVIKTYTGSNNQLWGTEEIPATAVSINSGDKFQILNAANSSLTIDISGGVTAIKPLYSTIAYEARTTNNANQTFSFQYDEATNSFRIVNPATGMSVDVDSSKTADGTRVLLYPGHSGCNQKWKITKGTDGYSINSVCSGKPLTTLSTTPASLDKIVIYNRTGNTTKWQLKKI